MTLDGKSEILKTFLENNGYYPGDPQIRAVYQYHNRCFNKPDQYLIVYPGENEPYMLTSPCVSEPRLVWSRSQGLTALGANILHEMKRSNSDAGKEPIL